MVIFFVPGNYIYKSGISDVYFMVNSGLKGLTLPTPWYFVSFLFTLSRNSPQGEEKCLDFMDYI